MVVIATADYGTKPPFATSASKVGFRQQRTEAETQAAVIGRLESRPMYLSGSAAATMARVLLVQMPTEQTAADAAGYRPERAATDSVADQRAAHTTGDRTDGAIPAAAAVPIVAAMTTILTVVGLGSRGNYHREPGRCERSRYHHFMTHIILQSTIPPGPVPVTIVRSYELQFLNTRWMGPTASGKKCRCGQSCEMEVISRRWPNKWSSPIQAAQNR